MYGHWNSWKCTFVTICVYRHGFRIKQCINTLGTCLGHDERHTSSIYGSIKCFRCNALHVLTNGMFQKYHTTSILHAMVGRSLVSQIRLTLGWCCGCICLSLNSIISTDKCQSVSAAVGHCWKLCWPWIHDTPYDAQFVPVAFVMVSMFSTSHFVGRFFTLTCTLLCPQTWYCIHRWMLRVCIIPFQDRIYTLLRVSGDMEHGIRRFPMQSALVGIDVINLYCKV